MPDERPSRRLTVVVAADLVGYSRLMGADEEGTLARLNAARREVIDPAVARHGGRIFKTTGDGLLAEFASAVEAVRCAVAVQAAIAARETERAPERRLAFRIGINLGDVLVEADDLFGDGVNVAARLEALADPGGIALSRSVRDQVRDRLELVLEDLGEVAVKNIARPVRAFRVLPPGATGRPRQPGPARRRPLLAAAAALALAGIAALAWLLARPAPPPVPPATAAADGTRADPPGARDGPPRLSIAVLPFADMSADATQEWFADGITEDLITDLSRIAGAFVIARNSSFTYKGKAVDVRQAASELGVRYVLEGSVRRADGRVRVNAQLIDAESGAHVWAERLDRPLDDLLSLQDEVTGRIARALNLELLQAASRRVRASTAETQDAQDLALQGWVTLLNKPQTPETNREGMAFADRAVALDAENALAWTALTYAHTRAASFLWSGSREESLRLALAAGERAIALAPGSSDAHYMYGYALRTAGRTEASLRAMQRAIDLNPNNPLPYQGLAYGAILLGRPQEAQAPLDRAFRLSPREPLGAVWHWTGAFAHYLMGDDAAAAEACKAAIAINPRYPHSHWLLAAAAARLGREAEAREALAAHLALSPALATAAEVYRRMAALSDEPAYLAQLKRVAEGLAKAGLPPS